MYFFAITKKISLIISLFLLPLWNLHAEISYQLFMSEPHTHYYEVKMQIPVTAKDKSCVVGMPVWTPGSYLVREFSRNVEAFEARDASGSILSSKKITKSEWEITLQKNTSIEISYKVYANELSVRTSFIDASHGYINGASVFMYVKGRESEGARLKINAPSTWSKISTALEKISVNDPTLFKIAHYDELVDSPIEIGNHKEYSLSVSGVPHTLAVYGEFFLEEKTFLDDLQRILESTAKVVGVHPCKNYTLIVHNVASGGGGLEHLNSCSIIMDRMDYYSERGYRGWLGLVAHEYFHLWNVKRIRPIELGPFAYNQENYTKMLWISEGFTSYYDELLLLRAGFIDADTYAGMLASQIESFEGRPGRKVQSLAEASFDAWIKFYRPDENSANTSVSYYGGGEVIAALLDIEILHQSKGEKNLDDLMRYLYQEYAVKLNRGFTDAEFLAAAEKISGTSLKKFFDECVYGTKEIDYAFFFDKVGLTLELIEKDRTDMGMSFEGDPSQLKVRSVVRDSPAYIGGMNSKDEIISLNGVRVRSSAEWNEALKFNTKGSDHKVLISRDQKIMEITLKDSVGKSLSAKFSLSKSATEEQKNLLRAWLKL